MMKHAKLLILGVLSVVLLTNAFTLEPSTDLKDNVSNEPSKLVVVWTSGDREVALKMVYMYTYNAKKNGWWDNIRFIVWGPSSKLLSEDKELQDYIQKMKKWAWRSLPVKLVLICMGSRKSSQSSDSMSNTLEKTFLKCYRVAGLT
jgi:hypothetical protein